VQYIPLRLTPIAASLPQFTSTPSRSPLHWGANNFASESAGRGSSTITVSDDHGRVRTQCVRSQTTPTAATTDATALVHPTQSMTGRYRSRDHLDLKLTPDQGIVSRSSSQRDPSDCHTSLCPALPADNSLRANAITDGQCRSSSGAPTESQSDPGADRRGHRRATAGTGTPRSPARMFAISKL
jgi:hypothetical protein